MGPAASSQYTGKGDVPKKTTPKKSSFPTREEMEAVEGVRPCKTGLLTTKKRALVSSSSPLGSKLVSLHRKSGHSGSLNRRAKRHLTCQVLAMADWVVEYNELSNHLLTVIPPELQIPYRGPQHGRGQFPLASTLEESSSMDVCIWCQTWWTYLCAMLPYFKDDMVAWEGALYGGKTCRPSALVLYIMEHVNLGLPEGFRLGMAKY